MAYGNERDRDAGGCGDPGGPGARGVHHDRRADLAGRRGDAGDLAIGFEQLLYRGERSKARAERGGPLREPDRYSRRIEPAIAGDVTDRASGARLEVRREALGLLSGDHPRLDAERARVLEPFAKMRFAPFRVR